MWLDEVSRWGHSFTRTIFIQLKDTRIFLLFPGNLANWSAPRPLRAALFGHAGAGGVRIAPEKLRYASSRPILNHIRHFSYLSRLGKLLTYSFSCPVAP